MQVPRWLIIVMLVAALVGFADASYLTAQHVRGIIPPCSTQGCELVLSSRYAQVVGIPVAVLGMLYYGTLLVLLIAYLDIGSRRILHGLAWLASVGLLATLYFVALQLLIIHAICPYCMLSALMCLTLFTCAVYIMRAD